MRRALTAVLSAVAIALPVANGVAATRSAAAAAKTKVVTRKVVGPAVQADRWGVVQVTLSVRKTTTITSGKRKVMRRIVGLTAVYPTHTDRSVFINEQAIPYLRQEALRAQFSTSISMISGATDTSEAFSQSLQSALLQARKV